MNAFSEAVKDYRKAQNLTQADLAKELETTQNTISMWEKGETTLNPTLAKKVSDLLKITKKDIEAMTGRMLPEPTPPEPAERADNGKGNFRKALKLMRQLEDNGKYGGKLSNVPEDNPTLKKIRTLLPDANMDPEGNIWTPMTAMVGEAILKPFKKKAKHDGVHPSNRLRQLVLAFLDDPFPLKSVGIEGKRQKISVSLREDDNEIFMDHLEKYDIRFKSSALRYLMQKDVEK